MALFFDKEWFDAKLAEFDMSRQELAMALGLRRSDIEDIWKDQRELSAREVATLASLLKAAPEEIAVRAGVSTPVPPKIPRDFESFGEALADLAARLDRLERAMLEIKSLLLDIRRDRP
jgi:transcriptional regulator with XRE-family HTH domain